MRKGRYRKNYLTVEDCSAFAQSFSPIAISLHRRFLQKEISAPAFVASYVYEGFQILKPQSWKGSRLSPCTKETFSLSVSIFSHVSFRGLPIAVNNSLLNWDRGLYKLQLFFEIPSTEVVLKMQSQGIRCVTCLLQVEELKNYVLGERDPLSFCIHDLIHADHFLRDPVQKQVQVGFSKWLLEIWNRPDLQASLSHNQKFQADFEYACADMNSHGAHLLKYLKAIFCLADLEEFFLQIARESSFPAHFAKALSHLNSPQESASDLDLLQKCLFQKGQPAASIGGTPYLSAVLG